MPTTKKTAPKTTAKKTTAKPVPTPKNPLPSGWVRQSLVKPDDGIGASRFTTQTQRRLLRAIVGGEPMNIGEVPAPTQRSIDRLKTLGYVVVAKTGKVTGTASGRTFVAANPAPRVRAAKKAPAKKAAAKKAPAKKVQTSAQRKVAAKKATAKKVVRKTA